MGEVTQQTAAPELGAGLTPAPPQGLWEAVVVELKRCFRPPAEVPLILAANALLMCGGWFLLPDSLRDWLFSIHGALAFPIVLESWMLSDVPSTNMLGGDAAGALAALGDGRAFQRFLYAKSLALWILSAPLCAAIAVVIGTSQPPPLRHRRHHGRDPRDALRRARRQRLGRDPVSVSPALAAVALGAAPPLPGLARALGAARPHAVQLRAGRLRRRAGAGVAADPPWIAFTPRAADVTRVLDLGALICCAMAFAAFVIGHAVGGRLAERRHARLVAYLTDPDRG